MDNLGKGLVVGAATAAVWLVVSLILLAIGLTTVEKGQIGVYNHKPMFTGKSGIENEVVVGPRRVYAWPTTTVEISAATPISLVIHAEDFMSRDRVPLDFDISMTIQLTDTLKAPEMYRKFGGGPLETFRLLVLQADAKGVPAGEFMSYLRDQTRHYDSPVFINAQSDDGKPSDGAKLVEESTLAYINEFLDKRGAGMIKMTNIALGRANPPPGVRAEMEKTVAQAQEKKTQVEREGAARVRLNAERAVAAADMAYVTAMGLSGEQFVALQTLRTIEKVCSGDKNAAHGNCMFVNGTGMSIAVPPRPTTIPVAPQQEKK